eukprot:SAG31_NODE_2900_length_4934_cov_2.001448_5_plen_99_part_00
MPSVDDCRLQVVIAQKAESVRRVFKMLANVRKQTLMWDEILHDSHAQHPSSMAGRQKEKELREQRYAKLQQLSPGTVLDMKEQFRSYDKDDVRSTSLK